MNQLAERHSDFMITHKDPEYPENLRGIPGLPHALFVAGTLMPKDRLAVAIVGTRRPSAIGKEIAKEISYDLAGAGITIVSGLAYGIDAAAHQAAISANGRTIACLGNGLDIVYPRMNNALYRKIPLRGALLSEYGAGTQPKPWHFPRRNRLISALSLGVVIVEAGEKSGALITADWALRYGRPVMAVPGSVKSSVSCGSNRLIQEGAYLVTSAADVLSFLRKENEYVPKPKKQRTMKNLSLEESLVLRSLGHFELVDDICDNVCNMPVYKVVSILSSLEVKGLVVPLPGGRYALTGYGQGFMADKQKVGNQ